MSILSLARIAVCPLPHDRHTIHEQRPGWRPLLFALAVAGALAENLLCVWIGSHFLPGVFSWTIAEAAWTIGFSLAWGGAILYYLRPRSDA